MNTEQVDKALYQKFITDNHRLEFWHDPDSLWLRHGLSFI